MEAILNLKENIIKVHVPWKQIFLGMVLASTVMVVYLWLNGQEEISLSSETVCVDYKDIPVYTSLNALTAFDIENVEVIVPKKTEVVKEPVTQVVESVVFTPETVEPVIEEVSSPEMTVIFHGNGGVLSVEEVTCVLEEFSLDNYEEPVRLGKIFTGWFEDAECTIPAGEIAKETERKEYYAGWSEYPGFYCDDEGYITGYNMSELNITDGLLIFPSYETCKGVKSGSFAGLEDLIYEVYIPSNITYLEEGVFDELPYLFYIEVAAGNPTYYSDAGLVYYKSGELAVIPCARR